MSSHKGTPITAEKANADRCTTLAAARENLKDIKDFLDAGEDVIAMSPVQGTGTTLMATNKSRIFQAWYDDKRKMWLAALVKFEQRTDR